MSFPSRIGLVGYGNMGRPICINLIKAGFVVRALDVDASRVALMRKDGLTPCQSSADLAGFAAISAKQLYVGTGEESRLLKLIINLLVLGSTALLGEALSFALRAGVDKNLCIDAINASIVGSPHYQARADLFKHEDLRSTGRWFGLKDIDMGMNQAAKVGAALPLMSLVHDQMRMTANRWPNANTLVGLTMLMRTINPPTAV